jgi:hypothetical protein
MSEATLMTTQRFDSDTHDHRELYITTPILSLGFRRTRLCAGRQQSAKALHGVKYELLEQPDQIVTFFDCHIES